MLNHHLHRALARSTSTDQRDVGTGLDLDGQVTEHPNTGTGWVAEVDALHANVALGSLAVDALASRRFSVDLGNRIQEGDDVRGSSLGGRHIRNEREHVPRLDCGERGAHQAGEEL